jgi:SAM-dependent methyltransferase
MKYYSRAADVDYWTELWTTVAHYQPYRRALRGHLPHQLRATFSKWVKPGARILEAGCGLAHFTVAVHALGYRAEGLDWSEKTIRGLSQLFPHIPWHVGDVRKLEFDEGAFDAVYSPGVCEHFEEGPAQILAETRRVLRPRGVAVVSTPCFNRWLQVRATQFSPQGEPSGEFYQYAFTPDGMSRLLERLGFELLQVRPYASLATMVYFAGWRVPRPAEKALAVAMDYIPVSRDWGSCCIWVARRTA